jgi:hypothetical protein
MPAQIAVLTVQAPKLLGPNISELSDRHLVPLLRPLKPWALFKQDHLGTLDAEANTNLVADGWRYARSAEGAEAPVDFRLLDFGQRHVSESLSRLSG